MLVTGFHRSERLSMASSWSRWQDFGGWRIVAFLQRMDSDFLHRVELLDVPVALAQVLPNRWDVPGRSFIFSPRQDQVTRSVQVQLLPGSQGEFALIGGAACRCR